MMRRYFIKLMITSMLILCFCSTCSANESESIETRYNECETDYQVALEMLEEKEYEKAENAFRLLDDYENSSEYASYASGMRITVEIRGIKETYDDFIAAGNIADAPEYVEALEPYISNCQGIYKDKLSDDNFILINDELDVAMEYIAKDSMDYMYELTGEMNDHYKIVSNLGMSFHSLGNEMKEYVYKIEFSKDYQSVSKYDSDGTTSNKFYKITEEQYENAVRNEDNSRMFDELNEHLDSYPLLNTNAALDVLVGNTFKVNRWSDIAEYTFYDDKTYMVKSGNGINTGEWQVIDDNIYVMNNGQPFYLYQVRKYFDGRYLMCRYNMNNDYYTIFISTCLNKDMTNSNDRDSSLEETYFYECPDILTPDSVDGRFSYEYTEQNDDIILHTYKISANNEQEASDIIQIYYDYLCLNKELRELDYNFKQDSSTGIFYITKHSFDSMIVAMQGGTDNTIGYFITCSMKDIE